MPNAIKMVCPTCGSDDIAMDAAARWNSIKQEWQLTAVFHTGDCYGCHNEIDGADTAPLEENASNA